MLFCSSLAFGSHAAMAGERESTSGDIYYVQESETDSVEAGEESELLWGYVDKQMYNDGISLYSANCLGDELTDNNRIIYDYVKAKVQDIAAGKLSETKIIIPSDKLSMDKQYWSASDLGVSTVVENATISKDAVQALNRKADYDMKKVIRTIITDCPYEMYWFGNTYTYSGFQVGATYIDGEYKLYISGDLSVQLAVSPDYAGTDNYEVDIAKTASVSTAVDNAKKVVSHAANMSDVEKLDYYLETICEYTDYNYDAADSSYTGGYGNPWQLIYVFDGDSSTKVVCEGYAKAFKYLCDMTSFDSDEIYTYCVSGNMISSNGGGGAHMWNVIHMDDGNCYLVDVTNCDQSTLDSWLFMAKPYSGDEENGYLFCKNSSYSLTYTYSEDTKSLYSQDSLTLSNVDYSEPQTMENLGLKISYPDNIKCGEEVTFTLEGQNGTGNYRYYLSFVNIYENGSYTYVVDPSKLPGYSSDNEIKFTFYASGNYSLRFYVMDTGVTPAKTKSETIYINIDDSNYPNVDSLVKKVCEECVLAGNETDYDKALWLHDWLLNNCKYDSSYTYCGAEGALARGLGTCESYYAAYKMCLDYFNIPNGRVTGNGHVWNVVKLGDEWCHIDCTWDDNGYSSLSDYDSHLYFGLNDELITAAHSEYKPVSGYIANSLDNNYFIRTGEISQWSDEFISQIEEGLKSGDKNFNIPVEYSMPDSYANIVYTLVAYDLSEKDWNGKRISVVYSMDEHSLGIEAVKTGWVCSEGVWYYYNEDGTAAVGWKLIGGKYYYFNPDGDMVTGWKLVGRKYYYFNPDGDMVTGWKLVGRKYYYFNSDGDMVTGWKLVGRKYYYFNPDGDMVTGWKLVGRKYYYFNPDGDMVTGWKYVSGKYYYFNSDGDMVTGWKYVSGRYYYFNPDGDMVTGWKYVSGRYYYFNPDGDMVTGWKYVSGKYYYFNKDGDMAANKWIDGLYYVKADGSMAVSQWINGKYYVDRNGRWTKTR